MGGIQPTLVDALGIFNIPFLSPEFMHWIFLPLHFGWMLVLVILKEVNLHILNVCPFDNTAFAGSGKVGPVNW